jgi:hypothetical protein
VIPNTPLPWAMLCGKTMHLSASIAALTFGRQFWRDVLNLLDATVLCLSFQRKFTLWLYQNKSLEWLSALPTFLWISSAFRKTTANNKTIVTATRINPDTSQEGSSRCPRFINI